MNKIKVLLVDRSEIFVEGLRAFFRREPTVEIACISGIGQELIDKASKYKPNLILADFDPSRHNEVELIKTIHRDLPSVRIILFTQAELGDNLYPAILAGVTGYVRKTVSFDILTKLITLAMEDDVAVFTSSVGNLVKTAGVLGKSNSTGPAESTLLSTREGQVLNLVARGSSNSEVASVLFISENTVKVHMRNIMEKLNVTNRQQAATRAIARGLLTRIS
jgi:DNA-binding NarL/FixJ family response regulator